MTRIVLYAFAVAVLLLGPLVTIWAVNLLFGLHVPYAFDTWFAVLWLSVLVGTPSARGGNRP